MPAGRSMFRRVTKSIQGRIDKSVEDDPDGATALYVWLWQSIGRRPGRKRAWHAIQFFSAASLDVLFLAGWYFRSRILRVASSARSKEATMRLSRTNLIVGLTIIAGGAISGLLTFSPLPWLPSDDEPVLDVAVAPSVPAVGPAPSAPAERLVSSSASNLFDLQQNYPNPFNPETTIPFVLHEGLFDDGRPPLVSIRIFNVLQQLVASPVALGDSSDEGPELIQLEYTQPGTYEAFWDGTDQSGRQVSSGVYFMQLIVNGLPAEIRKAYFLRRS